jgi:nickel/cobalt transporter (NicO) family protein
MIPRARPGRRRALAAALGLLAVVLLPAIAAAHPLGNFTINHYTGIRVEPDRILLDVVIDQAEIPTFQARLDFDTDGDGELSADETETGRIAACEGLRPALTLTVDGASPPLTLTEAGLSFPQGVGGLATMRMVCGFSAETGPLAAGARIEYADTSSSDRLGWREIVAGGSGMILRASDGPPRTESASARLTAYPTNLLTQALADTSISFAATRGGPGGPAYDIPDASPVAGAARADGATASTPPSSGTGGAGTTPVAAPPAAAAAVAGIPGGVTGSDLPSIFRTTDVTPIVLLVSILTAAALGAGHALTPGHGKTLMAAYLVGARGTPLHAAGLGLSVTFSHTLGILVLAALVVGAEGILPPDVVVKSAPIVAAISIVVIGGWMLLGEARRRRRHSHVHGDTHQQTHEHAALGHDGDDDDPGAEHSHGGVRHTHLPPAGATISWRSLFVLGLAGGLIPSTSALLILLGSIAAGRPAFGFVLVVAFGLGMAIVLGGIGLALVLARGRLDRVESTSALGRLSSAVPLVASVLVFGLGVYLTIQAVAGGTTF